MLLSHTNAILYFCVETLANNQFCTFVTASVLIILVQRSYNIFNLLYRTLYIIYTFVWSTEHVKGHAYDTQVKSFCFCFPLTNRNIFVFCVTWILLLLLTFTYQLAVSLTTQQIEPQSSRMRHKSKKKSWSSIWVMCKQDVVDVDKSHVFSDLMVMWRVGGDDVEQICEGMSLLCLLTH